jgi:ribonuclease HII
LASQKDRQETHIYCDRHGGRRFYAGLLQHYFPSTAPQVITETASLSQYCIETDLGPATISFTVKGDRFTPVAYSSLIAKWIREEMMLRLNHFFQTHSGDSSLEPTAGYPVDAVRFLKQTESLRREMGIVDKHLIRCR